MLTRTSGYALTAVAYLAARRAERDRPIRIDEVAAAVDVPRNYLSKILHKLARQGVLESTRGPQGGFRLAMEPGELTLGTIIASFDDVGGPVRCLLREQACDPAAPCIAHRDWHGIARAAHGFFDTTTIAALLAHTPPAAASRGT